jgi:hypothetical protein
MNAVRFQADADVVTPVAPVDHSAVYVVRKPDLERILKRFAYVQLNLRVAMGSVWTRNTQQERDELLQQLSSVPEIRAALDRQVRAGRKNQEAT